MDGNEDDEKALQRAIQGQGSDGGDPGRSARGIHDRQLGRRAVFAAELEIARWLLHGTTAKSTAIVDDAVEMLHALLDRVHRDMTNPLTSDAERPATLTEAHELADLGAPPSPAVRGGSPASPQSHD